MFGYLTGFCVYTFAMIGRILVGFVVAKRCMYGNLSAKNKDKFLEVETSLVIEPKKTIYVLKAGNEKFLIASDMERTSFLTKLDSENTALPTKVREEAFSESAVMKNKNIRKCSEQESYAASSAYKKKRVDADMSELQSNVMNRLLERLR